MKKKQLTKKTLSVFLSVLMLMTSWVFFPGMVTFEAGAAATDTTYRVNTDKYGTPFWSANDNNTRWMLWGASRNANDAHVWIRVPKTIYLDKDETLQSAGYKIEVEWSWGNGTDYRWGLGPAAWGNGNGISGQNGSEQFTMNNLFDGYSSNSSMNGSNEYGVNTDNDSNYDLRVHDNYSGSSGFIVYKNTGGTSNRTNYIYLIGDPKAAGTGRYSTAGINPSPFNFAQQWKYVFPANKWTDDNTFHPSAKGKPTQVSEQLNGYNEVWWNIEIYDKAALKSATDNATTVYTNNTAYQDYVLNNGLNNLRNLRDQGLNMLPVREQTYQTVKDKTDAINNAAKSLQFQAKNAALISKVADAKALQAKAGYNTLYTQASRQALQAAIEAATTSTLYTKTTVFAIANYTDAGARAAAEQTTINNLVNNITTAMNGLGRRYDVGYDNLFSLTDWALNPVKANMSNGTIEIDADQGTIKITHDGSANGTDNNTSQQPTYYRAEVDGDTEYVLSWNTEGTGRAQIHVFYTSGNQYTHNAYYNGDGNKWFVSSGDLPYSANMGKHEVTFKTLPEADGLVFRFGTCNAGDSVTFSDIRLVKKSDYDAYANKYTTAREAFSVGDTKGLTYTPVRDGYAFDGWYTADGKKVTDVSGFSASDIVYARWIQKLTVTFKNWDDTVIKTQEVAPGAAATAPANPSKAADADYEYVFAGWSADFSNVTEDLEVTATFTEKEHGKIVYNRITAATCTTPGKITKICTDCNYAWNNGEAYEDTTGEFAPALKHTFERTNPTWTVLTDGDKTETTHTVKCNDCDATTTKEHNFIEDANHPASSATCTVPGKTYYKCACLEEKTETGDINPNNHVNTEIRDDVAAECEKPGYTGDTWCKDCETMIKEGSATDALEHKYTTYTYNNDAKCGVDGTETATCDLCGIKTYTRTKEGSALEHKYTTYTYNNDAKCEVDGTKTALCDHGCETEDTIKAEGTALTHDYTGDVKDNGDGTHSFLCENGCGTYGGTVTCSTWKENTEYDKCECEVCGYTKDHAWGDWSQADTNKDSEAGKMTRTCGVCGAIDTINCTYTDVYTPATCEDDAYTTYTCTDANCGHGYTVIDLGTKKGHNFTGDYNYDTENDKHQQLCANGCGEYGVGTEKGAWADCVWSYENKEAGKHIASCTCGNSEEQDCTGGTATCTDKAECQFCHVAYGTTEDHVITGTEKYIKKATEATCIANETYYKYCIGCEEVFGDETYEKPDTMTAHDYTCKDEYLYIATQAECEVNETYYAYCSNPDCKKSSEDANNTFEKEGTALEHIWVDAQYNGEETLKHTFTCERGCGETMEASCMDSAVNFDFELATCTSQGYDIVQCSACNHTWNINYTDALGHDYTKKIYKDDYLKKAANCEHENIYYYACSRCERSAEEVTEDEVYTGTGSLTFLNGEVRKHDFQNKVDAKYLADEATCFAAAKYYTSCKYEDCGKSSEEVNGEGKGVKFSSGSALEHDWKEVEDDKYLATEADCVNDATYYYECSLCENSSKDYGNGSTWTKEDSKSGHEMTHTVAQDATCTEDGNHEYWYCSTCKKYFKDEDGKDAYLGQSETVIRSSGHDKVRVSSKAPTCEVDGNPNYEYCKNCDYTTYPAVLPDGYKATGHNFTGSYYYDSVNNYHAQYCVNTNCDKVTLTDDEGNPYEVKTFGMVVDGEQVKYEVKYDGLDYVITGGEKCDFTFKAETSKDGVHTHSNACVCGNNNTKVYSDEETFIETVAPTCTTDGYDSYACPEDDCDDTWKKNIVPATNHTASETATPNNDGTHSFICTVDGCGYKVSTANCSGGMATCKDKALCEICNAPYGETSDHTFDGEWVYQDDAACGVNGTEKNTCSVCETEVSREAKDTALEHVMSEHGYDITEWTNKPEDFDATIIKEPTCNEEGLSISYCANCDVYKTKRQPKNTNAHVWETDAEGNLVWKDAQGDCATGVTYKNYCTVCDKVQTKTEAAEHKLQYTSYIVPTCVKGGFREWKCVACNSKFEEYYGTSGIIYPEGYDNEDLAPTGEHNFVNTGKIRKATCTEAEAAIWKCTNCNEYDYRVEEGAEALGHDLVHYKGYEADCVSEGMLEHWVCTGCAVMFSDAEAAEEIKDVTIPAMDHNDTDANGKCDECSRVLYEDGKSCGCICHKESGLMKFIFKIVNFFWKLFKISKSCDCGSVHW